MAQKEKKSARDEHALATQAEAAITMPQIPEYMKPDAGMGTEDMTRDDYTLPRLALCQSMTRQRKPSSPLFIEGLNEGQLFNTISQEVYKGPVKILPLLVYKTRIKFNPLDQGGGIDCQSFNAINGGRHSDTCAACQFNQWVPTEAGTERPACNLFYNYLVVVNDDFGAPAVLSMKSTQLKVAKTFNSLVRMYGNSIMFSRYYEVTTVPESNSMGEFYNFSIKPMGWVPESIYRAAKAMFENLKQRPLKVDVEGVEDELGNNDAEM